MSKYPKCCPQCGKHDEFSRYTNRPGEVWCDNIRHEGCGWSGREDDLAPPSYVRELLAQVEADDALLLRCEWADRNCYIVQYGEAEEDPRKCPVCHRSPQAGHTPDCALGRRCDEARARRGGAA